MKLEFGGLTWHSKTALKRWIRWGMQDNGTGRVKENSDLNRVLQELMPMYSRFAIKAKDGFDHYTVVINQGGYRGLELVRPDGSQTGISVMDTVDELGQTDAQIARRRVVKKLRNEVLPQTAPLKKRGHEVHHEGKSFADLVLEWMVLEDITFLDIEISPHDEDHFHALVDRDLAERWQAYHKKHATLRVVEAREHREHHRKRA